MAATESRPESALQPGAERLFGEDFLRRLAGLQVVARRSFAGQGGGQRRTQRLGRGLEFADYRAYVPGDDLRLLDWNLYARLERPMVRLHEQESELALHILVDASASMTLGQPAKLTLALRIAAALAHVGVVNADRVSLYSLHPEPREIAREASASQRLAFLEGLARVAGGGTTDLTRSVQGFLARRPRRGLVVLLSDFYDPAGQEKALALLAQSRFELAVVSLSAPEEAEPTLLAGLDGDVVLVDSETGEERLVAVTPSLLAAYRVAWNERAEAFTRHCLERRVTAVRLLSRTPFEDAVLRLLRQGGLLR